MICYNLELEFAGAAIRFAPRQTDGDGVVNMVRLVPVLSSRRVWFKLWIVALAVVLALFFYPINSALVRTSMLATALISWVGVVYFFWHKKRVRNCFIWVSLLAVVFLSLPGRAFDLKSLRRSYVASLRSYEDVKYVWGGENRLGVDCSGLIRAGLVRANLLEGLRTLNPRLVRNALFLWWNDSSARALGEEHQQLTRHIMTVSSINELDESKILPGDFAVTVTGVHALAYTGDGIWIEADPHYARVITVKTPTKNPWFEEPVQIMRWSQIEETENSVGR